MCVGWGGLCGEAGDGRGAPSARDPAARWGATARDCLTWKQLSQEGKWWGGQSQSLASLPRPLRPTQRLDFSPCISVGDNEVSEHRPWEGMLACSEIPGSNF